MRKFFCPLAGISVGLLALSVAVPAGAATITVNDPADDFFASPGGTCSLREAVQAANTDADFGACARVGTGTADTIELAGGATYARNRSGADDTNSGGDLDITGETEIAVVGRGKATIDGNDLDRVITIHAAGSLSGTKLVIRDGSTIGGTDGGGILALGSLDLARSTVTSNGVPGDFGCCRGGGIAATGSIHLLKVKVTDNHVEGVGGGIYTRLSELTLVKSTVEGNFAGVGGGMYASGSNTVVKASTLAGNSAFTGPLPPGAPPDLNLGGGGLNVTDSGAVLNMTNSTISGNETDGPGGGIHVDSGSVRLNASTVTRNEADQGGGGLSGDAPFTNSIVAENVDGDCSSPLGRRSLGGRETGCDQSANTVTFDPDLRPLRDNGGPTWTHALEAGSRAIGLAGASAPPRDQRGRQRDAKPDAGAFER